MYRELAGWWPLVSGPEHYDEEAGIFARVIEANARRPVHRVLELGSGGGNNASHLKARYEMTLVDLSPEMLAVSAALNPECAHHRGDMRSVRLGERFDAVFVHDAIGYLTTVDDLDALFATARAHLEPDGLGLFVPDDTAESYRPATQMHGDDRDGRAMRYLEWKHEARGTTYLTSFAYLMREGDGPVRTAYEEHEMGLFRRAQWLERIGKAGFEARAVPYEHSSFDPGAGREMFLGLARNAEPPPR